MRARSYFLYAATIFTSAFLLFAIQPMAGKHLLPFFGGSSSVWATSMLFFTGALFFGYAYVFFLTKTSLRRQSQIHGSLLVIALVIFGIAMMEWRSLYPSLEWTIGSTIPPAAMTLLALFVSIGIPYFLLATTGPLLQYWYGASHEDEPYKLYAISNAGSFLALIAYPFLIEPNAGLHVQEITWAFLFAAYSVMTLFVTYRIFHGGHKAPHVEKGEISRRESIIWVLFAAFPSLLLVAATTQITQTIAPIPLLWIIPLALYLLTFIIAFAGWSLKSFAPIALFAAAVGAWWYVDASFSQISYKILTALALLFVASFVCHAELYSRRPEKGELPLFYLLLSLGGMLGALAASIIAPLVFNDYWEYALSIGLAAVIAIILLVRGTERMRHTVFILAFALIGLIAAIGFRYAESVNDQFRLVTRNFYGTAKIQENDTQVILMHGGTIHGSRYKAEEDHLKPAYYYVEESGMGMAIQHARDMRGEEPVRIAVIGLGAGMTAAYCKPGDTFVYYEIDSRIERLARSEFSYLSLCPQAEIRVGDARPMLEKEKREGKLGEYDVLIVDAFNDDTIPVHLLTMEAIETYLAHLRDENSVLAVHISNRYLDLRPPLMAIARELAIPLLSIDTMSEKEIASASMWVLFSKGGTTFTAPAFSKAQGALPDIRVDAWTDDYSDILSILDL